MSLIDRILAAVDSVAPPSPVSAHCDLPCGVYDPAQARIEAQSVKAIQEKYNGSSSRRSGRSW
jgi:nickel superoxide dismutase